SGNGPTSSATSAITAYSGGSSRSFSSASAASSFSRCAPKTRYTRRCASNGRMCRSRRISRTASIRIWSPSGSSTYRSGCERRSTRGSPPSSSEANASAVARLPTPAGPWKRYACAGPSLRAACRSRFASSCSGTLSKLSEHLLGDLARRARAVDRLDSLRKDFGELAVGGVDAHPEVVVLALDAVAIGSDPARRLGRVDQQQEGAVGQHAEHRLEVQLEDAVEPEPARDPLVGERRVEVAVADHVRAALQRRRDHLLEELRPRRREQRRLGPRRHLALGQQQLAHPLTELRPARLARGDHVAALARERLGEQLRLGRLAGAVEPFERHEHLRLGYEPVRA